MTRTPRTFIALLAALLAAFAATNPASAQTRQELEARLAQRYPQLVEQQKAGKIGETFEGLVEAVKKEFADEPAVRDLLRAENTDRRRLYTLIAEERNITPEQVSALAARVNFRKARPYEYLKVDSRTWVQKRDWKG